MEKTLKALQQACTGKERTARNKEIREKYGNKTILLFKSETNYLAYDTSAEDLTNITGAIINNIDGLITSHFPTRCADVYFTRIVREGYKICIIEE